MTKWELAQLMGLNVTPDRYSDNEGCCFIAYVDGKQISYIVTDTIEEAQEQAAIQYFDRINHKCFTRCC